MVFDLPWSTKDVDMYWSKADLIKHFKKFDLNNDGKLSFSEVQAAFRALKAWNAFACYYRTAKGIDYADGNNDECINLDDHELTDLVGYAYNLKIKVEPATN